MDDITEPMIGGVGHESALEAVKPWLSEPNVTGLSIGPKVVGGQETGEQAVLVFVERKLPASALGADHFPVPATVELHTLTGAGEVGSVEVPTDVQETGPNRIEVLNQKVRPAPGGYQIAAENIGGTGTLGVNIVWAGKYRTLSNNHVLSNNGNLGAAIYQPDKANDTAIGTVDGYVPITLYASSTQQNPIYNNQDLAWSLASTRLTTPEITRIGTPTGLRAPVPGETVTLIGKQTASVQRATVRDIITKTVVEWMPGAAKPWAFFERIVRLDRKCTQPGDSGTAYVATSDDMVVGLHIASNSSYSWGCQLWPF